MSIFGSIIDSIFHHASSAQAGTTAQAASPTATQASAGAAAKTSAGMQQAAQAPQAPQAASSGTSPQAGAAPTSPTSAGSSMRGQASVASLQNIDVAAVLEKLAASKGGGGNWRTSIVDLLKLLGLDSSLTARKELANELGVHAGADGSAEQNMALQKAVMAKLAENGGKVPDSLRH